MAKKKAKRVKAKVTKAKQTKLMSRGNSYPYEVWAIRRGEHEYRERLSSQEAADSYITKRPELICPVIVYIDIPPMEY